MTEHIEGVIRGSIDAGPLLDLTPTQARDVLNLNSSRWGHRLGDDSGVITVLWTGQSNSIGRDGSVQNEFLSGVTVWNNTNDLNLGDTTEAGTAFVSPSIDSPPFVRGATNAAIHFANHLHRVTGKKVRLIIVGRGSTSLLHWTNATGDKGDMYNRIALVLAAAEVTSVDILGWQQGETDDNQNVLNDYKGKWGFFINHLQTDGYITASTPILIGEIRDAIDNNGMNQVFRDLAYSDSRIGIASIGPYEGHIDKNDPHFIGSDCPEIGWRFLEVLSAISPFDDILDANDDIALLPYIVPSATNNIEYLNPKDLNAKTKSRSFIARHSINQTGIANNTFTKVLADTVEKDDFKYYSGARSEWTPPPGVGYLSFVLNLIGVTANGTVTIDLMSDENTREARINLDADASGNIGQAGAFPLVGDGKKAFWIRISAPSSGTITSRNTSGFGMLSGMMS
jgi:hypothetical protein